MIYAVKVSHGKQNYLAAITKHKYLADLIKEECLCHDLPAEVISNEASFPIAIREINNEFTFYSLDGQRLETEDEIVYTVQQDWFPNQMCNDEMGLIDHEHHT